MASEGEAFYMNRALDLARAAASEGEIPIGAVIVDASGAIIGEGSNKVEQASSQLKHAELIALDQATQVKGDWRLDDCWMYITLEPCIMCLGALGLSRIGGITFAAPSPEFGGLQFVDTAAASVYFKRLLISRGLKEGESVDMLRLFFKMARGEECREPASGFSIKNKRAS